jgi:RimJ/RimL family protein N-acetyltransferase
MSAFDERAGVRIRGVKADDSDALLSLRNDAGSVAASASQRSIPIQEHLSWFSDRMASRHPDIWVAEQTGRVIGYARLDRIDRRAWISVAVARDARGVGVAGDLIRSVQKETVHDGEIEVLRASVRLENRASIRVFEKNGFEEIERSGEMITFEWQS